MELALDEPPDGPLAGKIKPMPLVLPGESRFPVTVRA
jgi:hypothetical protein